MKKSEAINAIVQAARIYETKLHKKKVLIIFGSPNKPECIEARFPAGSFVHLTGVDLNKTKLRQEHPDKQTNLNELFYEKAVQGRISPEDFSFKSDGTTELKLSVITHAIDVIHNAKMIGDFKGHHCKLDTDKLAGSIYSSLGFVLTGKYYVPNTVLATDTRNEVLQPQKVLAILSKRDTAAYTDIERVAKKIDIEELLQKVSKTQIIDSSLLPSVSETEHSSAVQSANIMQFQPKPLPRADVLTAADRSPRKGILDRLRDFVSDITAKIQQTSSSSKQQDAAVHKQSTPHLRSEQHDKPTPKHVDQDHAHGEHQQLVETKPHTISRAKRSEITAQSQRAGHTAAPQQRGDQIHSHDDALS